jgi:hypothetical protein
VETGSPKSNAKNFNAYKTITLSIHESLPQASPTNTTEPLRRKHHQCHFHLFIINWQTMVALSTANRSIDMSFSTEMRERALDEQMRRSFVDQTKPGTLQQAVPVGLAKPDLAMMNRLQAERKGLVEQARKGVEQQPKNISKVEFAPTNPPREKPCPKFKTEAWVASSVAKLASNCRFLSKEGVEWDEYGGGDAEEALAIFHRNEINTCNLRGAGGFSEVYQVWGFTPYEGLDGMDLHQEHKRDEIMMNAIDENGRCRYVMKHIRADLQLNRKKFHHAAADLVRCSPRGC